jgi:uncharacterized membrane protein YqgA involved in biofilm formation
LARQGLAQNTAGRAEMILTGVLVNAVAIVFGCALGLLLGKAIPEKVTQTVMSGLALCVLYVGISGSLNGENAVIIILSIVIGAAVGELLDFHAMLQNLGDYVHSKIAVGHSNHSFTEGFVTCTLMFCVGAMAIVGSLQSGLTGSNETLFAKSVIDGVFALIMATTLGIGVGFAAVSILLYEGVLTLSAHAISGYLTTSVINEITCVGSLLIIGIALNMLGLTKLKIANFILAPFLPILFYLFV